MCLPVQPYKIEREWEHAGLLCAVVQGREGQSRCGYVRVPIGHPAYGQDYTTPEVDVHGGLTFGAIEPCSDHADGQGYWFGFDCCHYMDATWDPNVTMESLKTDLGRELFRIELEMRRRFPKLGLTMHVFGGGEAAHYWTQAEVEAETERLAEQFAAIGEAGGPGREQ